MSKVFVGIDPGLTGAVATISDGKVSIVDIDGSSFNAIDLLKGVALNSEVFVCIEKVGSMPKQGVASTFKFGKIYGELIGAVKALGLSIEFEPTPQVWKKFIFNGRHSMLEKPEQKDLAREQARKLYPAIADMLKRKKDADRAEAVLLAHYGKMNHRD
jgi:hypothetical protein